MPTFTMEGIKYRIVDVTDCEVIFANCETNQWTKLYHVTFLRRLMHGEIVFK